MRVCACVTNEPQRHLLVHREPSLCVEAPHCITHHELPAVVFSPHWVTGVTESFPGISFMCQQALGLAEGFIYTKQDKRAHVLRHRPCWYQGTEPRARYGGVLPPPATSCSSSSPARCCVRTTKEELVGVMYPLLVRPCHWRHHMRHCHVPI